MPSTGLLEGAYCIISQIYVLFYHVHRHPYLFVHRPICEYLMLCSAHLL